MGPTVLKEYDSNLSSGDDGFTSSSSSSSVDPSLCNKAISTRTSSTCSSVSISSPDPIEINFTSDSNFTTVPAEIVTNNKLLLSVI